MSGHEKNIGEEHTYPCAMRIMRGDGRCECKPQPDDVVEMDRDGGGSELQYKCGICGAWAGEHCSDDDGRLRGVHRGRGARMAKRLNG
jgi:hypothetical protein